MSTETRLGSYEVKEFLSDIGLDDLYLAHDTRAGREVVVRAVPVFVDEAAVIERLRLRAADITALGNESLLAFPTVEKTDGMVLAVAERPAGRALDHYVRGESLLLGYLFDLSLGLVHAVDALHSAGHIHGYLHAGRVVVGDDRLVRVLVIGPEEAERTPTRRAALCRAPELRNGNVPDSRSEVFALGALLYEIATSTAPFSGETAREVAESVQNDLPLPITDVRPDLPRELARIVARCLKKDPTLRYASVRELCADIEELGDGIREGKVAPGRRAPTPVTAEPPVRPDSPAVSLADVASMPRRFDWRLVGVAAGALLAGAIIGFGLGGDGAADAAAPALRFSPATSGPGPEVFPSLSADGSEMVFTRAEGGDWDIYLQSATGGEAIPLTADSSVDDHQAVISPDGLRIAFRSERDGGGTFVMDRDGGGVNKLVDFGFNPSWSPDRTELLVADVPVFIAPDGVAARSSVTAIDVRTGATRVVASGDARQPSWSPVENRVAYWGLNGATAADIWTVPAAGGEAVLLVDNPANDWNPVWAADGNAVYFSSDRTGSADLWKIPIDAASGAALGPAAPVTASAGLQSVHLAVARDAGTMAFAEARTFHGLYRIPVDAARGVVSGDPEVLPGGERRAATPQLSDDGRRIAFAVRTAESEDIFVTDLDGGEPVRITTAGRNRFPRWSPDGRRLAFLSDRGGSFQVWTASSAGGDERQLTELKTSRLSAPVWSSDGRGVGLTAGGEMTPSYTMLFDPQVAFADQYAETLLTTPSERTFEPSSWSRGGSRIAGTIRDRGGRLGGIAFLEVGAEAHVEITDFGVFPTWLRDGRRLIFQSGNRLYLVDTRNPEPRELFVGTPDLVGEGFSLSADNRWIYVALERTEADAWFVH